LRGAGQLPLGMNGERRVEGKLLGFGGFGGKRRGGVLHGRGMRERRNRRVGAQRKLNWPRRPRSQECNGEKKNNRQTDPGKCLPAFRSAEKEVPEKNQQADSRESGVYQTHKREKRPITVWVNRG